MKKWLAACALALLLPAAGEAADLYIDGLGTLPFGQEVHVTDGRGTAVEAMLQRNMAAGEKATKQSALMQILTVPDGLALRGYEDAPVSRARIYQLVKEENHSTYTMMVFVFSGEGKELFQGDRKRMDSWAQAFQPGADRKAAGVRRTVRLEEYREAIREAIAGKPGAVPAYQLLDASTWKPYCNEDGTVRWQQSVKFTVTNQNGLVVPMWIESVLYRNFAGRYYLLIFTGSHESGRRMAEPILYGLYQVERERV